jgi:hypothetical protein
MTTDWIYVASSGAGTHQFDFPLPSGLRPSRPTPRRQEVGWSVSPQMSFSGLNFNDLRWTQFDLQWRSSSGAYYYVRP